MCVNCQVLFWNVSSMRAVAQLYSLLPSSMSCTICGRSYGAISVTIAIKLWPNKNCKMAMSYHHQHLVFIGLQGLADLAGPDCSPLGWLCLGTLAGATERGQLCSTDFSYVSGLIFLVVMADAQEEARPVFLHFV